MSLVEFAGSGSRVDKRHFEFIQGSRGDRRALFKRALCSLPDFGLSHLMPPFHAFFPPLLSIASLLSEVRLTKRSKAMQRCYEEQRARSKGARLSPLEGFAALALWALEVLLQCHTARAYFRMKGMFHTCLSFI